jgi:uncharacterized protein (DUF1330 family)
LCRVVWRRGEVAKPAHRINQEQEPFMPAYFIAAVTVTDPEKFPDYLKLAGPAAIQYGGKFLVGGGQPSVLEGTWPPGRRTTIIEFADEEAVRRFYDSPEYRAAREARAGAAVFDVISVSGV